MIKSKLLKILFVPAALIVIYLFTLLNSERNYRLPDLKKYPSNIQMLKRTFPFFKYDLNAYPDIVEQYKLSKEKYKLQKHNNENILEFVGPTNIGGRVVDIEFNPIDIKVVYAAAATGGVFKSLDGGITWFPIFDDQPCLSIGDIAIDPNNPNVIYVGTGEANGGHNNFPGQGIFKSTDAGQSWNFIGLSNTVSIGRILVDPNNSDKIIVAAVGSYFTPSPDRGIFISTNAGQSWRNSLFVSDSTGAIDLVINPQNSNELYAAMWERVRRPEYSSTTHLNGSTSGIYKSTDGGNSWQRLTSQNGLPNSLTENIGRIGLSICNSSPNVLYAMYNDGFYITGLYRTDNKGDNWTLANNDIPGRGNFSWYFGQVRVNPLNPDIVYVLDVYLSKSIDGGKTFTLLNDSDNHFLHVDHHVLTFTPGDTSIIVSGNDGGINISTTGGLTWEAPADLPITQFYEIALDPNNSNAFYGGTQDNNTIRTISGNITSWESIYGGDGFYIIVDPVNPEIIYAESQFGNLGKSVDGGKNFSTVLSGIENNEPTNWSTPVVMDPNNNQVLYYGTHSLYRTEDAATTWTKVSPQLTDWNSDKSIGTITTIDIANTNSNVILLGTDDGNIWISSDYGTNWENISSNLPIRWVTRVKIDPNDENQIYVTFSGLKWAEAEPRVFKSDNKGKSWQSIINGLPDAPVNAFEINPKNSNNLFLGNDVGVYTSYDSGNSWELLTDQIPIVVVNDLKIHQTGNYLAIGTHGRGFYKYSLNDTTSTEKYDNPFSNKIELYQNYPNPFNPTTTIRYTIPSKDIMLNSSQHLNNSEIPNQVSGDNQNVKLTIYDVLGREIKILVNKNQSAGNYSVSFNGSNLSTGIYYYMLKAGNNFKTKKMLLLK